MASSGCGSMNAAQILLHTWPETHILNTTSTLHCRCWNHSVQTMTFRRWIQLPGWRGCFSLENKVRASVLNELSGILMVVGNRVCVPGQH